MHWKVELAADAKRRTKKLGIEREKLKRAIDRKTRAERMRLEQIDYELRMAQNDLKTANSLTFEQEKNACLY